MTQSLRRNVLALVVAGVGLPFIFYVLPCVMPSHAGRDLILLAALAVIVYLMWPIWQPALASMRRGSSS